MTESFYAYSDDSAWEQAEAWAEMHRLSSFRLKNKIRRYDGYRWSTVYIFEEGEG